MPKKGMKTALCKVLMFVPQKLSLVHLTLFSSIRAGRSVLLLWRCVNLLVGRTHETNVKRSVVDR